MVDLATLKLHLKVDPDVTVDDPLIIAELEAAVATMQHETGEYYGPVGEIVEVLSVIGSVPIALQVTPEADAVETPITLEMQASPTADWEAVAAADFEIIGAKLYPRVVWAAGTRLRLTYTGGYADGAAPPDVQRAVRELVTTMYQVRSPSVVEIPDTVARVIRAHRVVVF